MKYSTLFNLPTWIVFSILTPPPMVMASVDVEAVAAAITVKIDGNSNTGSGVVIERNGNTYYVLTSAHVVQQPQTYILVTANGDRYPISYSQIQFISGVDLAVVSFDSSNDYTIAQTEFGPTTAGQPIYVAGWTRGGGSFRQQVFFASQGILESDSDLGAGYTLSYTNLVRAGMSGGPILNQQGNLIGINGLVRLKPESDQIVSGGISLEVFRKWRENNPLPVSTQTTPTTPTVNPNSGNPWEIAYTANSPDAVHSLVIAEIEAETRIYSSSDRGMISLWSSTGDLLGSWQGHRQAINSLAVNSNLLASGSDDGTVKLWNLTTGELLATLQGHNSTVTGVAFSPDGELVASGSWDKTVKIWQVSTGKLLGTIPHDQIVTSIGFADNQQLVSGSQNGMIYLWNWSNGELVRTFSGHSLSVLSLALSQDGKLVSGSGDRTIRVWNLATGELITTLEGHQDAVWSVAIAADGNTIVSGSWDHSVMLWDLAQAKSTATLGKHPGYVGAVAITHDGNTIVSGDWQNQIRIWQKN